MRAEMAVALLRGINVGGKNLLPMKALAEIFAAAGCAEVKTYIQSGNVVYRSGEADVAAAVRAEIEARFGLKVPVIVRSAAEMARCVAGNPFAGTGIDPAWLHVMFLEDAPPQGLIAGLDAERSRPDEFAVRGREVYLHLPNGAGKTKLTNAYFDARLKTVGTQRNWRTVMVLAEMMGVRDATEEWVRGRKKPTAALAARAMSLLDKAAGLPVEDGDELPEGYGQGKKG